MIPAGQWRLDDERAAQLKPIAEALKLEFPQLMDRAIDELIERHRVPVTLEPPTETPQDKQRRERIKELSLNLGVSETLIRRDILKLNELEIAQKYGIHQHALLGLRKYIKRTYPPKK